MLTALQQFKDDYDRNQPMWRVLPEFCQEVPDVRAHGPSPTAHREAETAKAHRG